MSGPRVVSLTPTEAAVLAELAVDGASNAAIAERLGIGEWTVKSHMKRVMAVFEADNRAAVVAAYLRRRVIVQIRRPAPATPRTTS